MTLIELARVGEINAGSVCRSAAFSKANEVSRSLMNTDVSAGVCSVDLLEAPSSGLLLDAFGCFTAPRLLHSFRAQESFLEEFV